jgi:hypothetical protein
MPDVVLPPAGFTFGSSSTRILRRRPVVVSNRTPWLRTLEEAYALWPLGLVEQVLPRAAGARVCLVDARQRGLVRSLRPGPGRAVSRIELGARAGHDLLEGVRALRPRHRAPRRPAPRRHRRQETTVRVLETLAARPTVARRRPAQSRRRLPVPRPEPTRRPAPMVRHWRRYLALNPNDPTSPKSAPHRHRRTHPLPPPAKP